ncbi:MAG: single-stranded-DNA-specific exonuclease RecJ, partial [Clostridiales bacterium]|nr:single-stranded-DNA-specific exonuclease RecJ [Clostridiales bacterium]
MRFDKWAVTGFDREAATEMFRRGINPLAAVFMCTRGITKFEDAIDYITDKPSDIHDPMLLGDMDKAVGRINLSLERREKIVIFGDYDVDGMTASALMKSYLSGRGANCEIYIPGRVDEGYGISTLALDHLSSIGTDLVVTVDCGITAIEESQYAKQLGIDLVITDHHECREQLPDAVAVVNPKRRDNEYPNRALAGVGVAFKLICALEKNKNVTELLREYGDLVALGTVADVMPVVGENRALIRAGLQKFSKNPRPGLAVLMKSCGASPSTLNTATLGFTIAPRLNAAGRMGDTSLAVDILLTEDQREAARLTEALNALNTQRRELE